jgi:eukaryotic-like serine/threonine-protein kinase
MEHPDGVRAAQFSPDGWLILPGEDDRTARLWHTDSGQIIGRPLQRCATGLSVASAPDGRTLATGSAAAALAGEARIWGMATGQPLTAPLRHSYTVRGVAFSPDGKTLPPGCGGGGDYTAGGYRATASSTLPGITSYAKSKGKKQHPV